MNNVVHVHSNSWGIDACESVGYDQTGSQDYHHQFNTCPFNATAYRSPCGRTECLGFDWATSSIPNACVNKIHYYCSQYNVYEPACEDHWDLFISCTHLGLSQSSNRMLKNGITNGRIGK